MQTQLVQRSQGKTLTFDSLRDRCIALIPGISRYSAGPDSFGAVAKARSLSEKGFGTISNILGEHDQDPKVIEATVDQYCALVDRLSSANQSKKLVRPSVSLKPTQFGLAHEAGSNDPVSNDTVRFLSDAIELATSRNLFVWLDMENRHTTDFTINFYRTAAMIYVGNIGVVLQANLKRSESDLDALTSFSKNVGVPVHVRLVRGIYDEPSSVAFVGRAASHASFARLIKQAFSTDAPKFKVSVGTHQPDQIIRTIAMHREFAEKLHELQFLMGAATKIPEFLVEMGLPSTYYVPSGPRFAEYGWRRVKENPGSIFGLVAAPLFESRNLGRVKEFFNGTIKVDIHSPGLELR